MKTLLAHSYFQTTKRPLTAGTLFKNSMVALVKNLACKEPYYIRCIKPNEQKSPVIFDEERVTHQVCAHWFVFYGPDEVYFSFALLVLCLLFFICSYITSFTHQVCVWWLCLLWVLCGVCSLLLSCVASFKGLPVYYQYFCFVFILWWRHRTRGLSFSVALS